MVKVIVLFGLALAVSACSTAAPTAATAAHDTLADAAPDTAGDAPSDAPSDIPSDIASDIASDATASVPFACPAGAAQPWVETQAIDVKRKKFAMSLFHFNIEYVINGLECSDAQGQHWFMDGAINKGWGDTQVEDYIVDQTFRPMLEMYDKHPSWGVNFELQGRMIEVIAQRHPKVLALLQKLAWRGQVELVSFHANDQLFLAFPREDLHRSIARTKAIFAEACLPLSGVVFDQEGQAGEGRQKVLLQEGYTIGVFPKNLFKYVHKDAENTGFWPLYSSEGGDLIVGPGGIDPASGVEVAWNFFDDGELCAVGETDMGPKNPYFAPSAPTDPARVAAFEAELAASEAQGFYMARISDYVRHLKSSGLQPKPAPPLLDGTWQAPSTKSIHRWLGGSGVLDALYRSENDDGVRTGNVQARHFALVISQLASAGLGKIPVTAAQANALWSNVWRAQVSDCSGVNPWYCETLFGLQTDALVLSDAKSLLAAANMSAPAWDTATQKPWPSAEATQLPIDATILGGIVVPKALGEVNAPFDVTATGLQRPVQARWEAISQQRYRLHIDIGAAECGGSKCLGETRMVALQVPRLSDTLEYSPGLLDGELRSYPLSAFQFALGEAWLPLGNGLLGLGPAGAGVNWYLIKHTATSHLSVRVAPASQSYTFQDETVPESAQRHWVFELIRGTPTEALAAAQTLCVTPVVALHST